MKDLTLKIKVCGMRDAENIRHLIELNPDYIGFILYPGSKRYLGDDYILDIDIPDSIQRVGVFVNALMPDIFNWSNRLNLDFIQLHGIESPDYCIELHRMGIKVIKAFGIDDGFDFSTLKPYLSCCNFFLFDTKTDFHGGSGKQFDWNTLIDYSYDIPVFLSGGIGPDDADTINHYKKSVSIHGVDVNSRFEINPGQKNIVALKRFILELRSN